MLLTASGLATRLTERSLHYRVIVLKYIYMNKHKLNRAFTIVELLVVIVVIGILAAITMVSYSGISARATTSAIKTQLSDNSKLLKMYYIDNDSYPTALDSDNCPTTPAISKQYCLRTLKNSTLTYTGTVTTFNLSIKDSSSGLAYSISENDNIAQVTAPTDPSYIVSWGGPAGEDPSSILQTSDGGFIISGTTSSFGNGNTEAFIAKFNSTGNLSWTRTWGGASNDSASSLVISSDNGYVLTGQTSSYGSGLADAFIAKFDSSGNLLWSKTWGGVNHDYAKSITLSHDGGYVIAGASRNYGAGGYDAFITKFDSAGNFSWNKTWGGTGSDEISSIVKTSDNGFIATGYTGSYGVNTDTFLIKFDSAGNFSWNKTWGGADGDYAKSIIQTLDNGYVVTGHSYSFGSENSNGFLAKFDSLGDLTWDKAWGGNDEYGAQSIIQTATGDYVVGGDTYAINASNSDSYLVKFDNTGNIIWNQTWGGDQFDYIIDVVELSEGGYATTGHTNSYDAEATDVLLSKYRPDGMITKCVSPMCQNPNVSSITPGAAVTTPSASVTAPTVPISSPSVSITTPTATNSIIVAPF